MALFCVAIRIDSIFLLKSLFLNHVQVFLYEISSVCCLKCFSFHFCFLSVVIVLLIFMFSEMFPVALISFSLFFFLSYLPTPPLGQDMTQGQFLSGV